MKMMKGRYISMIDKQWVDIPGFEGLYIVSSLGDVLSKTCIQHYKLGDKNVSRTKWGRPLAINNRGQVRLVRNGRSKIVKVDRLVATLFVPNPNNYKWVKHLDGDPDNCKYYNLEWTSTRPKY